jgi:hypothetical protein
VIFAGLEKLNEGSEGIDRPKLSTRVFSLYEWWQWRLGVHSLAFPSEVYRYDVNIWRMIECRKVSDPKK